MKRMKAQDYYGASKMLGPKIGVGPQLLKEFPSALHSHCLCNYLNLSTASVKNMSRLMKDMIDVCVEINRLIKYSPKRERFLGQVINVILREIFELYL